MPGGEWSFFALENACKKLLALCWVWDNISLVT